MIYAQEKTYNSTLKFPEDNTVDYLPQKRGIQNEYFDLIYLVEKTSDGVTTSFQYFFKETDLSMLGYLVNSIIGSWLYNFFLHKLVAIVLLILGD